MITVKKSLVVLRSDSRAPILFSAALCILSSVGRSAFLMAFSVRSGISDSSLLCPSSSSSSSSSCVSASSGWSGSSSSWGASGASELDELEEELSDEDDSCTCSFSFGTSLAGLRLLRLSGFLASALGGGVAGRRAACFPASTLVAFVLPRFSPLTVVTGRSWLGDSGTLQHLEPGWPSLGCPGYALLSAACWRCQGNLPA